MNLMKKQAVALAFAAASLLSSGAAMAQQIYVGGAIGQGHADVDCFGASNCDKTDTAYKLFAGYGFGNGLSVEGGYMSFGKATASAPGASSEIESGGPHLGVAFNAPIGNRGFGLGARVGVISMKTKISASLVGFGSGSESETNAEPYFGFGASYAFAPHLRMDLGADFSRAEFQGDKADVRAVTLGLTY